MEEIRLTQLKIEKMNSIKSNHHIESTLYYDNDTLYKIFKKDLNSGDLKNKKTKVEILAAGPPLPTVVMPIDQIYYNRHFSGYTMKYISNATDLYNFDIKSNPQMFLNILLTISKSLEEIHKDARKIIIGDLSFNNIIVDEQFNPYIVDIDSCKIVGIENETISGLFNEYLCNRKIYHTYGTPNEDRLSMLLSILYMIFRIDIDNIIMYVYDKIAERSETLQNIRSLILEIKNSESIPYIPYFHEMIPSSLTTPSLTNPKIKVKK